jgi:hypothetical protein
MTVHWQISGIPEEFGQFGIRFNTDVLPSSGEAASIAGHIATFWEAPLAYVSQQFELFEVKFAVIEPSGLYPPDAEPLIHTYTTPVQGGNGNNSTYPLQVSSVASLLTSAARGRAHRGRIYLPPINADLNTTLVWQGSETNNRAGLLATMLTDVNGEIPGQAAVYSRVGSGIHRLINGVEIGNRPDVQRRRARSQPEAYSTVGAVTDG